MYAVRHLSHIDRPDFTHLGGRIVVKFEEPSRSFTFKFTVERKMTEKEILDTLGRQVVSEVVDPVCNLYDLRLEESCKADCDPLELKIFLSKLSSNEVALLKKITQSVVKTTTHYFLWQAEQEKIKMYFHDVNIAELSDGLTGKLYLEDGWLEKYSKF